MIQSHSNKSILDLIITGIARVIIMLVGIFLINIIFGIATIAYFS